MRRLVLICALAAACRTGPAPAAESRTALFGRTAKSEPAPPLVLPELAPSEDVSLDVLAIGDPGYEGPLHDAAFAGLRALVERLGADRTVAIVPGDLAYQVGLPADCASARARLAGLYTEAAPGLAFVTVAGNHDHGTPRAESKATALRAAYFDCAHTAALAPRLGWSPAQCACLPRWEYPTGAGEVGTRMLVPAAPDRVGFTLVALDTQSAIMRPKEVARSLASTLATLPARDRLLVLAHHPFESAGPHGDWPGWGPQDLRNSKYEAYVEAMKAVLEPHRDRIAAIVFGHEHILQLTPGPPARIISGAGAKTSSVRRTDEGFALGDTPGLVVLRLHRSGDVTAVFVTKREPVTHRIPRGPR